MCMFICFMIVFWMWLLCFICISIYVLLLMLNMLVLLGYSGGVVFCYVSWVGLLGLQFWKLVLCRVICRLLLFSGVLIICRISGIWIVWGWVFCRQGLNCQLVIVWWMNLVIIGGIWCLLFRCSVFIVLLVLIFNVLCSSMLIFSCLFVGGVDGVVGVVFVYSFFISSISYGRCGQCFL